MSLFYCSDGYMELPLTDELRARLANAGHWMIQFNKIALNAFNITDIVLLPKDGSATTINSTACGDQAVKALRNGQVLILRDGKTYNTLGVEVK